jgi:hypothetical protein
MTLPSRQERILRRADRALSQSDPHLASMLSIFARLAAEERIPAREQLRAPPARAWRILLWPAAAAAAYLVILAAGGGTSAARRAARACAQSFRRCARRVRGIRAASPAAPTLPAARRDRPRP